MPSSTGTVRKRQAANPVRQVSHHILNLAFGIVLGLTSIARAEEKAPAVTEETSVKQERYLGVVTEPVPDALAAQLKDRLPGGRGLVVKRLLPDSPAEKSGVRPFDVLTAANDQPLTSPDQLKDLVTRSPLKSIIRLELIREAKTQTVDVLPGQRSVSRLIHRHASDVNLADVERRSEQKIAAAGDVPNIRAAEPPSAYTVGVQTRDGRQFQVEASFAEHGGVETAHKAHGTAAEVTENLKFLPKPVLDCVVKQMARVSEDRQTLRSVRFRFTPRPEGQQQVLKVTLRKPQIGGVTTSFEWQQPMGEARETLPLEVLLENSTFTAQLDDLDPVVREKIESTLKHSVLPAGSLKVESSQ